MARGLDVPECDVVVNLELPSNAVHYAHRAGRTGRMGRCSPPPQLSVQVEQHTGRQRQLAGLRELQQRTPLSAPRRVQTVSAGELAPVS